MRNVMRFLSVRSISLLSEIFRPQGLFKFSTICGIRESIAFPSQL
jgi:hypothetical protein